MQTVVNIGVLTLLVALVGLLVQNAYIKTEYIERMVIMERKLDLATDDICRIKKVVSIPSPCVPVSRHEQ